MRVPIGSWRQDLGLFIELSATRHVEMGGAPSYEISFSWSPSCLSAIEVALMASNGGDGRDAARAAKAQAQTAEFCPPLPGGG